MMIFLKLFLIGAVIFCGLLFVIEKIAVVSFVIEEAKRTLLPFESEKDRRTNILFLVVLDLLVSFLIISLAGTLVYVLTII